MAGEAGRVEEEEEEEEEEDGEGECCQAIMLCRRHRLLPRFLRIHRSTTRCDSASASTSNDDDGAEEPRDSQCNPPPLELQIDEHHHHLPQSPYDLRWRFTLILSSLKIDCCVWIQGGEKSPAPLKKPRKTSFY